MLMNLLGVMDSWRLKTAGSSIQFRSDMYHLFTSLKSPFTDIAIWVPNHAFILNLNELQIIFSIWWIVVRLSSSNLIGEYKLGWKSKLELQARSKGYNWVDLDFGDMKAICDTTDEAPKMISINYFSSQYQGTSLPSYSLPKATLYFAAGCSAFSMFSLSTETDLLTLQVWTKSSKTPGPLILWLIVMFRLEGQTILSYRVLKISFSNGQWTCSA